MGAGSSGHPRTVRPCWGLSWAQKGSMVSATSCCPGRTCCLCPACLGNPQLLAPCCDPPHPNATPMPPSLGPGGVSHGRAPTNLRLVSLPPDLS